MLVFLSGCAHSNRATAPRLRTGSGDAGKFIVEQAVLRGAQPITTKSLTPVRGSWRSAEDNSGIIIRMAREDYSAVEALLLEAFGPPQFGPTDRADGSRVGAYRITARGGLLEFGRNADATLVIVLREKTDKEAAAEFLRRLQ